MYSRLTFTPDGWLGKLRRAVVIVACGLVALIGGCGGDDGTQSQARLPEGGDLVRKPQGERGGGPSTNGKVNSEPQDQDPQEEINPPEPDRGAKPPPTPEPPEPEPIPELPEPAPIEPAEDPELHDNPADSDVTP